MHSIPPLMLLGFAVGTLGLAGPQPKLDNISYWGSACPEGGLSTVLGPVDATTNTASLTFTLSNFLPTLGSFGSSLRMCNILGQLSIDEGWKVRVNAHGTSAQGNTNLPGNATMFLRSTYSFTEKAENQSIGMVDVAGPLSGQFSKHLTPADGDQGVVGPCAAGELVIEFQARAVADYDAKFTRRGAVNGTSWTLTTDVDVSRC